MAGKLRLLIRSVLIAMGVVVLAIALAWLYLAGRTIEVRISEEEIQSVLRGSFPLSGDYVPGVRMVLENPRFRLVGESEPRIHAGMDVRMVFVKGPRAGQALRGSLDVSGALVYDPLRRSFYLDMPSVERLSLPGMPASWRRPVERLVSSTMKKFYEQNPVYALNKNSPVHALSGLLIKDVRVEGRVLVVRLGL